MLNNRIQAILIDLGFSGNDPVILARTSNPEILRAIRDSIIFETVQNAERWRDINPDVWDDEIREVQRFVSTLKLLVPDE